MTVIPFPPRKEEPKQLVPEVPPTKEEIMKAQAMAMMKAALDEAGRMGIQFEPGENNIKDSLLCMEAMLALLMRIGGEQHRFHLMSERSFERQPDGSFKFWPPYYEDQPQ